MSLVNYKTRAPTTNAAKTTPAGTTAGANEAALFDPSPPEPFELPFLPPPLLPPLPEPFFESSSLELLEGTIDLMPLEIDETTLQFDELGCD